MFAQSLAGACGSDPGIICELVFNLTGSESVASLSESLTKPLRVAVILIVAWVLARLVRRAIHRTTESWVTGQTTRLEAAKATPQEGGRIESARRRISQTAIKAERGQQRARTLSDVLESTASLVIYSIAGMIALSEFNVNLGPLIAGAGIVGVAVGFGAQSLVKDFLSGIFMLLEDQYGIGDIVDVGDASGVVEEVRLRTTQIRDVEGTLWHIPNGEIRRVANKSQDWARAVMDIEVAYDTDLRHAMATIKAVAVDVWNDHLENATILEEPEIWGVQEFGASAIVIRLVVKVEPAEQWSTAREIRKRLKWAFDEEGIEIPFPQQTVWLHNEPGETESGAKPPPAEKFLPRGGVEGEM